MDRDNLKEILFLDKEKNYSSKVKLFIPDKDVPDPYYGGEESFNYCFKLINQQCEKISRKLLDNA